MNARPATVLCLSGHDPTGGAGLQADIEAVAAQGAHAFGIITAHTVQDTRDVRRVQAVAPALLAQQLDCLLDDCPVDAIKIGLLGDAAQLPVLVAAIERLRVPVVLDPVLRAGGGSPLSSATTVAALRAQLLPRVELLTPNAAEARRLCPGAPDLAACGAELLQAGCAAVLITGGDEDTPEVDNRLFRRDAAPEHYRWPRLPQRFHGAGCTLASAIAARRALGEPLPLAVANGQRWTQAALAGARAVGGGRHLPWRRPA